MASDRGNPPLNSTATVRVEVRADELAGDLYGGTSGGFSLLRRPYLSLVMLAGILVVFVTMSAILVITIVVLARKQHASSSGSSPNDSPMTPGSTGATNSPAYLGAGTSTSTRTSTYTLYTY